MQGKALGACPDVLVTCDPAGRRDNYLVRPPMLVAKVRSLATAEYDRTEKLASYQKMSSAHPTAAGGWVSICI